MPFRPTSLTFPPLGSLDTWDQTCEMAILPLSLCKVGPTYHYLFNNFIFFVFIYPFSPMPPTSKLSSASCTCWGTHGGGWIRRDKAHPRDGRGTGSSARVASSTSGHGGGRDSRSLVGSTSTAAGARWAGHAAMTTGAAAGALSARRAAMAAGGRAVLPIRPTLQPTRSLSSPSRRLLHGSRLELRLLVRFDRGRSRDGRQQELAS
jgi:hypothetical protein